MKNTSSTLATVPAPGTLTVDSKPEHIRNVQTILPLLHIDGERVTIPKGANLSPSEIALFIADRAAQSRTFGMQARWTYYSAGQLPNGDHVQKEIRERLDTMMSKHARHQLTSEAMTLAPLAIAEGFKAPLSLLKDANAELNVNKATGKLAPMRQQTAAARKLIPLLKSGEITQAKIRDIRKANAPAPVKKPAAGPKAKEDAKEGIAFGLALGKLKDVSVYLDGNKVEGGDRSQFVTLVTDIARKIGLTVGAPAPISTATVAKGK